MRLWLCRECVWSLPYGIKRYMGIWNVITYIYKKTYSCSGPPAFKSQRVGYQFNQKFLYHGQHSKKISSIYKFILKVQQILGSHELKSHGRFWPWPRKNNCTNMKKTTFFHLFIFDRLLIFAITYQHAKNQFIASVHSSDTISFRDPSSDWPHQFLTTLTPQSFNHLLICVKLYQHAKSPLVSSVLS